MVIDESPHNQLALIDENSPLLCGRQKLTLQTGAAHRLSQTDDLQKPDRQPAHVEFIPRESMSGGRRIGVMIVVPALAETQQGHEPVVP